MKIGFVSMPLSGHLNPMTALARTLQSRGNEVVFFGVPDVEPFARAAGLDKFNLKTFAPTPAGAARVGNPGVGILEGPGTIAVNAGLSKAMTIREGFALALR